VNGEEAVVEDLNKGHGREGDETGATGKLLVRLAELAIKMNWKVVGELFVEICTVFLLLGETKVRAVVFGFFLQARHPNFPPSAAENLCLIISLVSFVHLQSRRPSFPFIIRRVG